MKFIFDAHLDLSMNALEWNRDFRLPVHTKNPILIIFNARNKADFLKFDLLFHSSK